MTPGPGAAEPQRSPPLAEGPPGKPRAVLVWNPVAGAGSSDLPAVVAALEETYALTVLETSRECDGDACSDQALALAPALVIVAGGDGTVSLVASRLVGQAVPMAVLPRGTANSFARALGIPTDLAGAIDNARRGRVHTIDTARAAGRVVLLFAAIGFHADAIGETTREAKNRWGLLAYLVSGLQRLANLEPFAVELETAREIIRCRATNVTVANLAPPQSVAAQGPTTIRGDDGRLDITVIAVEGLSDGLAAALHLYRAGLAGAAATRDDIGYLPVQAVTVRAEPAQRVMIDGEEVGETPVTIECVPASLRVVVPATPEADADAVAAAGDERKLAGLPGIEVSIKVTAGGE